jgi:methyl-accepting chemotaxis protein
MVNTLKGEARTSVSAMNAGSLKADTTAELAQQAENALLEITSAIDVISNMNVQIASATEQQSAVAEQVNVSISRILESGTETSTGSQQVAAAAEELAQLSENLKSLIGQFKVC